MPDRAGNVSGSGVDTAAFAAALPHERVVDKVDYCLGFPKKQKEGVIAEAGVAVSDFGETQRKRADALFKVYLLGDVAAAEQEGQSRARDGRKIGKDPVAVDENFFKDLELGHCLLAGKQSCRTHVQHESGEADTD